MVLNKDATTEATTVGGIIMSVFLAGFFELSFLTVNRIFSAALPLRGQIGKIPTLAVSSRVLFTRHWRHETAKESSLAFITSVRIQYWLVAHENSTHQRLPVTSRW